MYRWPARYLFLAVCVCSASAQQRPVSATTADLRNDPTGRGHLLVRVDRLLKGFQLLCIPWLH